ncbi:PRP21 [Candida margitis]|uniref:PRP21 n=1 Tax=Candida margitis TaxID=1775924 RepID=UPI00222789DA|nr:PRP21 [Candida margitis]KAI5969901.1 PRP21 [Candida margitis]
MPTSVPENLPVPPKDIKDVIEKSVVYIKKNGKSFEDRLLKNNKGNQFDFIKPDNEFHAYYLWALNSYSGSNTTATEEGDSEVTNIDTIVIPKPRDLEFLIEHFPDNICERDLQIIKKTAIYIAVNGEDKIKGLLKHEQDLGYHAQFDFLKPQHSLHALFQEYVTQYKAVLDAFLGESNLIKKELSSNLKEFENNEFAVLTKAYDRAQYRKQNKVRKKMHDERLLQKRIHFASVDWQDFTLVEYVKFDEIDVVKELSTPLVRGDLSKRSLTAKSQDIKLPKSKPISLDNEDDESHNEEAPSNSAVNESDVPPARFKGMKIKAAGTTRLKRSSPAANSSGKSVSQSASTEKIKCPVTGKLVPAAEFDDHLRSILRDPSYKQQQENYLRKNFSYESNITTDQAFENIKRLMRKRHTEDHGGR